MNAHHLTETAKYAGDALSIGVVVGTLADILPAVAALLTVIWTLIRIFETKTVQQLLGRKVKAAADDE